MDYTKLKGCHPGGDPVGLKGPDGMNTLSSYQAGKDDMITIIKAEIERRIEHNDSLASNAESEMIANLEIGAAQALDDLLPFLSTLESEKPVPADLEEAAEKYTQEMLESWKFDSTGYRPPRESFIAGAKWQAEHTPLPEDTVLFNKGVEDGKRLMMEEAVEGVVCYGSKGAYIETDFLGEYDTDVYGNPGDKVRVIIVKEDRNEQATPLP